MDPEERYTIDEFLAHPWCNVCTSYFYVRLHPRPYAACKQEKPKTQPDVVANAAKAGLKVPPPSASMPVDSPLLQDVGGGPRGGRSPGINTLREAFDVTYAVHRMEEEGARKRAQQQSGGRGFLPDLNEGEEDEEATIEKTKRKYGETVASAMREQVARNQEAAAAGKKSQQIQPSQYQGWGGADRRMAEAALYDGRAGARDRGRQQRNAGFELSLNNATLLGKRAGGANSAKPSPLNPQVKPSPLSQQV